MQTRILYRHPGGRWLSFGKVPATTAHKVAANFAHQCELAGQPVETKLQPDGQEPEQQQPRQTAQPILAGTLF